MIVLAFITLTLLDGSKIDVEALRPNVSFMGHLGPTYCHNNPRATVVIIGCKPMCVLETKAEIRKLVDENQ